MVLRLYLILFVLPLSAAAQQVSIPRVDQMPDFPSPYEMRDWRSVALGYDSLAFNTTLTGTHLPLSWTYTGTVNYPSHPAVGLRTYVGTHSPLNAEAINVLPALISASLVGIDKSGQNGINWALMAEEFFNNRPAENVYLNNPVNSSGDDWWYDTMPNVFFYQLASFYPTTGDFPRQFRSVADRWLQAMMAMGGGTTPWQIPNIDHRGWSLSSMQPNDASVHEPEAAGAIAWLLYHAYVITGERKYRTGAELAMEALVARTSNPAYEIQLPYGALAAARMNAESGTSYDVAKLVNWCFAFQPLRSWGTMAARWGAFDCAGLVGELNGSNDYAFLMNTLEQVGALVPLTRYEPRFAQAIGKWVLNAANASRLFYPNALPDQNQDSESWSHQYDPHGYIGHEALRQYGPSAVSPYATGDAIQGGWAETNLSLYSSSHAGILGGIIDTTDVRGVLRLDLLKTDYYHGAAYPSFLFYNPYVSDTTIHVRLEGPAHDLYDAVSKTMLQISASSPAAISIPGHGAVLLVVLPSGSLPTYEYGRMLVNGIVADYATGQAVPNMRPHIKGLGAMPSTLLLGQQAVVYCTASDRDNDTLAYAWKSGADVIPGGGQQIPWAAPAIGSYVISCTVSDLKGGVDTASTTITVLDSTFSLPAITRITARPGKVDLGATTMLTCLATDPKGYPLTFTWRWTDGTFTGSDSTLEWTAPNIRGNYAVSCTVENGHGGLATDSVFVEVRDLSVIQTGALVAWYPFSGSVSDASGFGNHGANHGATFAADRFGQSANAAQFNGTSSYILLPNASSLNFTQSISVAFMMKVGTFYNREQYPISHGNWQNRWKISITPDKRIRWTVKTTAGGNVTTKDLDSRTVLIADTYYHVTCVYDGSDIELYLNGNVDAFAALSGTILPSTVAPTIGQSLPSETGYNFNGILDDVRIYNYALPLAEIQHLSDVNTSLSQGPKAGVPVESGLEQNFPNPFNPSTVIRFHLAASSHVSLIVVDILGREVASLFDGPLPQGEHAIRWDARGKATGVYYCRLFVGGRADTKSMVLMK